MVETVTLVLLILKFAGCAPIAAWPVVLIVAPLLLIWAVALLVEAS